MEKIKVAIIGCGNISDIYFKNLKTFDNIELVCCADLVEEKSKAQAEKYEVACCSVEEIMANKEIGIIVNLTTPQGHYPVAKAAIENGHSVYNEKPLTMSVEQGKELIALAKSKGLRLGGAPDTFMGAGIQTCRKLIDEGAIGKPLSFTAFMMCGGHESWHPAPEFYYKIGGGPLLDMGPYYLTALANLLGGFDSVQCVATTPHKQRTITSKPKNGEIIEVETPTHINGLITCKSGAVGTLITSFDVKKHSMPNIEIYGTEGSITVPDPNCFDGKVKLFKAGKKEWEEVALVEDYSENSRGLGVSDMANAIINGGDFKADHRLTFHVLETMYALLEAGETGEKVKVTSECEKPEKFYK